MTQNATTGASPTSRMAAHARLVRALSGVTQIGLMIALFVMWKQMGIPFKTAFERCFVAGVLVYVALGTVASILATIARVQPIQLLLRHILGAISLLIFGALHFVYHMGILQSAVGWVIIYGAARMLVRRIEARAMARFR
ncbi:MAG TPA: hypothetical protein VH370_06330 [Humisphaera sp.]|jgi:hypothetical protein|nr:hypothetical protein [Humisphaera sp.]